MLWTDGISQQLFVANQIIWNAATTTIRVSIVLFYREIFPINSFQLPSIAMIGLNILNFFGIFLTTLLICRPLSYAFVHTGDGSCGNIKDLKTYSAVSSLVFDMGVVFLPMPFLWRLQIHSRKKWGITALLSFGLL
jgi:hypothetical protein